MATLLESARLVGISRMSLPFLFGTFVTGDRRRAMIAGYVLYLLGGWAFAFRYAVVLGSFDVRGALSGALGGLLHGLFLVSVLLPLVHPRLASEEDGPEALGKIEPPGRFGLNYGRATPLVSVAAQALFGLVSGTGYGVTG